MKTNYVFISMVIVLTLGCNKNDDSNPLEIELQNEPPLSFNLVNVPDGATEVDVLPTLSWESAKNPKGSEVTYDLYLGKETNPTNLYQSAISGTSFQIDERLSLVSDYYWKVVATDGQGQTSQSAIQKFTTRNLIAKKREIFTPSDLLMRQRHTSVVFGEKLWFFGGYDGEYRSDIWHSEDGSNWTKAAPGTSIFPRSGHTTVTFNDKLQLIGGFTDQQPHILDDVWQSADGLVWEEITTDDKFFERGNHTSVVFDDKIWVIGGSTFKNYTYDDVWSSTDGETWIKKEAVGPYFMKRSGHASVVFKNKIWVIGGNDQNSLKNDVWSSSDGVHWELVTPIADFSNRQHHTVTIYDDKMWLVGGSDGQETKNDVWYSSDGSSWTELSVPENFPTRRHHTAVVFNDKIWIIGGLFSEENNIYAATAWVLE